MSTAKSRNFRRRGGDTESNDGDGDTSAAPTLPSKPKKPQAPKLLSFADDEETDENPRPRPSKPHRSANKPSSSHKITTLKDRIVHSSSLPSNVQPQAGTYTKEALRELQKNTRTLVTSSSSSRSDPKPSSEPVVVLKGLLKPLASEPQGRDSDSEGEHKDVEAKLAIQNGEDSFFPDEETIRAIRAKRERLRQARPAAPDYISLDGGSNHGAAEGLSDEEPEFRGRIAMYGEKVEGGKKGVFEKVEERRMDVRFKGGEVEDDDDEEEKMWEEEQFRKGLGKRMDEGSNRVDVGAVQGAQQQHTFVVPSAATVYGTVSNAATALSPSIGGAIESMPALDVVPISQQAEIARKALVENVRRLKVWTVIIMSPNWLYIRMSC